MADLAQIVAIEKTRFCTSAELKRISRDYPLEKTLDGLHPLIRNGKLKPGYGGELFRESNAASLEAERFFGELIGYSVQRGSWVGYNIGWNPSKVNYVEENIDDPEKVSPESSCIIKARDETLRKIMKPEPRDPYN